MRYMPSARHVYGASLVLGIAVAVGLPWVSEDAPVSVWDGLLSSTGTEIILLMNPANCQVDAYQIKKWNALHAQARLGMKVVFLKPPAMSERETIERAFGFKSQVLFDDQDRWLSALIRAGLPRGGAVLARDGRIRGAASLDDWSHLVGGMPL